MADELNRDLQLKALANHSSEIRMRNFNFFIVVTVGFVAGIVKLEEPWLRILIELGGSVSSLLFLGLDVRGYSLFTHNWEKVKHIEPLLWERAGLTDVRYLELPESKWLSHRMLYRAFFVIVGTAWLIALIISLPKL